MKPYSAEAHDESYNRSVSECIKDGCMSNSSSLTGCEPAILIWCPVKEKVPCTGQILPRATDFNANVCRMVVKVLSADESHDQIERSQDKSFLKLIIS